MIWCVIAHSYLAFPIRPDPAEFIWCGKELKPDCNVDNKWQQKYMKKEQSYDEEWQQVQEMKNNAQLQMLQRSNERKTFKLSTQLE